jgi:ABC-2 type transport system permease protein
MQAFLTLLRRELAGFFLSFSGYVILASGVFLIGLSFYDLLSVLQHDPTPMPVTELFYLTPFFWVILILATPVITMRLFALEKFSGTFETLVTAPVTDLQIVLAKFCGAMVFYLVMWLPLLGCILLVKRYSSDPGVMDAGVLAGTFTGIFLLGGFYISMGCCASAMTRNQVVAAMTSLVFGAGLFLAGVLASQTPAHATWQSHVLSYLGLFEQMHDFARGVLDTRPIIFLMSMTLFFLFLTLRIVESRRWK